MEKMEDRASDNRARRRREAQRQLRSIVERTAKLRKENCACPACDELFDCADGCVVADARAYLRAHS